MFAPLASAALGVLLFSGNETLHGSFVYDDAGTVQRNPDVDPSKKTWEEVLTHDIWGENLTSPTSHKSFRPVVSWTYRQNHAWGKLDPYGYHVVNVILHGAVCFALTTVAQRTLALGAKPWRGGPTGAVVAGYAT